MVDLISELIKWDQEIFLRTLFLSLDLSSLRNCKMVSKSWRYFLSDRVLGCAGLRSVWVGRLWEDLQTEDRDLVVGGSVTSIGWDRQTIVCGYSDGTAEVFAGECIARLSDVEEVVHYIGSRVDIGKDILVKIAFGSDGTGQVASDLGVWNKRTGQRIFKALVDNQDTCLHVRVVDNMVFYKTGSSLTKINVYRNDVVLEDLKEIKDLSRQDFLTNREYFVFRSENKVSSYKVGCDVSEAREVTAEQTVLDMTMKWPNVLALHGVSFSVVNFPNTTIQVKGKSTTKLVSIQSNLAVVAVMNSNNQVQFYKWADLVTPTPTLCCPISSLQPAIPPCPYSQPCLALHDTGLVAVSREANCVQVYSLGRGLLEEDGQELVDEKEVEANQIMEFVGRKNSGAGIRDY